MDNEMSVLRKKLKENLNVLINQNRLDEAKEILNQYENIAEDDVDIYSIKGIIAMIEGDMERAERVLLEGLDVQPFNFDILYNLIYLYEIQEKYITAYRYCQKIIKVAKSDTLKEFSDKIKELEKIEEVNKYKARKKVLFIAHIFPPVGGSGVQRSLKFVKYLRNFGWEPIVVTVGKTSYPFRDETMVEEIPEEIEIIKIDEATIIDTRYVSQLIQLYAGLVEDEVLLNEYINQIKRSERAFRELILLPDFYILWATEVLNKLDEKIDFNAIDMVYTTSGPYSDHIIGYYLKLKYNKPWVADFRDEWTNNPYANYDKRSILYKINFSMEKSIVRLADRVIAVTPLSSKNYRNIFNLEEQKVITITNGYDEEDFEKLVDEKKKNQKFTIVHNGLLYSIRTPETFMKAVKKLIESGEIDKEKIKVFFGWTENINEWISLRNELGLQKVVEFLDYMTHADSLKLANNADILLLIIGSGEKNKAMYPGKIFEYLRLCKPILALSPKNSEVDELIKSTKRGYNADYYDVSGISKYLLEMYQLWDKDEIPKLSLDENVIKFERSNLAKQLSFVFTELLNENKKVKSISGNNLNYFIEKDSNFYDKLFQSGGLNDTYHKHYSESHYYETWLKALELIKEIENPNIIDIGCGPGQFANLLFDNNIIQYRGIDFSEEAIKLAKIQNNKYAHLFALDNAYTTNLFNQPYNTVIMFEFLEHIDNDLKIISRVRENTNILFSVPNFYCEGHVRWFNSKQEVFSRYKDYVDIEDIFSFLVGGTNKIFLVKGRTKV